MRWYGFKIIKNIIEFNLELQQKITNMIWFFTWVYI